MSYSCFLVSHSFIQGINEKLTTDVFLDVSFNKALHFGDFKISFLYKIEEVLKTVPNLKAKTLEMASVKK